MWISLQNFKLLEQSKECEFGSIDHERHEDFEDELTSIVTQKHKKHSTY